MPRRCNSPSPVDNHTRAPIKMTVRTAPSRAPSIDEYLLREFPRIATGAGSLASGAFSIVICMPNNFSVDQAKNHCLDSFAQLLNPLKYGFVRATGKSGSRAAAL